VIQLWRADWLISKQLTDKDGLIRFANLPTDAYIIRELQPLRPRFSTTPNEAEIMVIAGSEETISFGDWDGRQLWGPLILR